MSESMNPPLQIIRHPVMADESAVHQVTLSVDRQTLAKRRWQITAADGAEFGFDLEHHLHDGDTVAVIDRKKYVLAQTPEPVIAIPFAEAGAAAHIAWSLGNLHFPVEIHPQAIHVADDPAVRLFLAREKILSLEMSAVFHPIKATSSHGHTH